MPNTRNSSASNDGTRGRRNRKEFIYPTVYREAGYRPHFRDHRSEATRIGMKTGAYGHYKWPEGEHDLREFLLLCSAAIAGRHIAITAVGSGSFIPSDGDRSPPTMDASAAFTKFSVDLHHDTQIEDRG